MPKKSNTRRADGRIAVQVYLGRENGKRIYKTVYGKTQKEAEQKATALKQQLHKGIDLSNSDRSFSYWADMFLLSKKQQLTHAHYTQTKSRLQFFVDKFGYKNIETIKLCDGEQAIMEIAECNPITQKPSAKKTLIGYTAVLKRCFDYALANRVIEYNPMQHLSIPNGMQKKTREALTAEQQQWIIDTEHRAQLPAMIMLFAGLRRGEVSALLWSDVDLQNKTITVNKSYDFRENKVKTTKTAAGIRVIPIPDILVEFLKSTEKNSVYVCPCTNGTVMRESAWQRLWNSYMQTLNQKYGDFINTESTKNIPIIVSTFTPHCLRHTYCTMLYESGIDAVTAKNLMGHKDISTTLGIYTHLSREKAQTDIEKLNSFLQSKSSNASRCASQKSKNR